MFDAGIAQAREMIARLQKNKLPGLKAGGTERVSIDEFVTWENGIEAAVRQAFGRWSAQLTQWRNLAGKRQDIAGEAIRTHGAEASFDGYTDYLNRAIGLLANFDTAIAARGGVAPSPWSIAYGWLQQLPKSLRVGVVTVALLGAGVVGTWAVLPESTQKHFIAQFTEPEIIVSIRGVSPERFEEVAVEYKIDETNNVHNPFGTHVRDFAKSFDANPGYRIVSQVWHETSATRVSDRVINIEAGGERITMAFTLKSCPITDQYAGWIHGSLRTIQRRTIPARTDTIVSTVKVRLGADKHFHRRFHSRLFQNRYPGREQHHHRFRPGEPTSGR